MSTATYVHAHIRIHTHIHKWLYMLLVLHICIHTHTLTVNAANCLQGLYSFDGTDTAGPCTDCPAGYTTDTIMTIGANEQVCRRCAPGYEGTSSGIYPVTGCTICSIGKYTPGNSNGGQCISCKIGYTTINSGNGGQFPSSCTLCDAGYQGTSSSGTSGCSQCSSGSNYNEVAGNGVVCTPCDANSINCTYNSAGTCAAESSRW